jgi:putative hemolysin
MLSEILIIVALTLLNAFFSGAEIAVISLRKTRLRELVEGGSGRAKAVDRLRHQPENFLATVQVGITVVGATAAAFGGSSVAARLAPLLRGLGLGDSSEEVALGLVVAGVSFLSIVVGELVPKSVALRSAEAYALFAAKPLLAVLWLARPIVWLLTASSNLVLRLFGDRTTFTEARVSPDELRQLVEDAAAAGELDAKASEMASRAIDFRTLAARAVMVPRSDVVMVPVSASVADVRRVIAETGFARVPVFEGSTDNVVGYVAAKDLFAKGDGPVDLRQLSHPMRFLPEGVSAVDALRELQRRRVPVAMLVDEGGGIEGLVTAEDLVEEVVGELHSENEGAAELFLPEEGGTTLVEGATTIRDLNRALPPPLTLPEGEGWTTVAGLALALAGAVPRPGTTLRADNGVALEVVEASPRKVHKVRLHPPPRPAEETRGGEAP